MPKRPASALETPLNARTVAARLGIALSTLNAWLAAEEERPLLDRRFHFHTFHGRKRLWSEANFQALERAIEAESEPGGRLAGWRTGSGNRSKSAREGAAATAAMLAVLGFRYDEDDDDVQPAATEVKQCPRR
jgi:hypothetical protein